MLRNGSEFRMTQPLPSNNNCCSLCNDCLSLIENTAKQEERGLWTTTTQQFKQSLDDTGYFNDTEKEAVLRAFNKYFGDLLGHTPKETKDKTDGTEGNLARDGSLGNFEQPKSLTTDTRAPVPFLSSQENCICGHPKRWNNHGMDCNTSCICKGVFVRAK